MVFSGGPRSCIGKNLALTETKVMMIKLMQRFDNVIEHSVKERKIEAPFTLHIKDCKADLIKRLDL